VAGRGDLVKKEVWERRSHAKH